MRASPHGGDRTARILVVVGAFFLLCGTVAAQPAPGSDSRLLLIDLSDEAVRSVSFDWTDYSGDVDLQKACEAGPEGAQKIKECIACSIPKHSTRWISRRASELQVFVLFNGFDDTLPKIVFAEVKRRSRLASDLATAMKLAKAIVGKTEAAIPRAPALRCASKTYALQHDRANLKVTAEVPDVAASDDGEGVVRSAAVTLITGSAEHLFLSADLPTRRLNDVKLTDGGLEPTTKPTRFFIGLNYAVGDLDDDRPRSAGRTLLGNLVGRVMFEASSTPFDSFGVALALRGSYLKSVGIDFNTVSPFAGYIWTRPEPDDANTLTGTLQFGFSFNLDKALGWVQDDQ